MTSTRGPSYLGSLPVVTLVKAEVLESDDGPKLEIQGKALILYIGLIVTKVVGYILIENTLIHLSHPVGSLSSYGAASKTNQN